jgi:hypothetical protein
MIWTDHGRKIVAATRFRCERGWVCDGPSCGFERALVANGDGTVTVDACPGCALPAFTTDVILDGVNLRTGKCERIVIDATGGDAPLEPR